MSERRDPRPLVERLVPDVFAGENRSPTMSTFLRGVTTGALVGAAIAGSALWTRYKRQRSDAVGAEDAAANGADTANAAESPTG